MNNYITRKLLKKEEYYKYGGVYSSLSETYYELYKLITGGSRRIVLIGDAGYGKSTELKTVAYRLIDEENQDYIPIYIELNTYVDEDFIDYVLGKVGKDSENILDYDKSKLVFLLDEFDQVVNKEIATRKIKSFMEIYDKSAFVTACRTNFYSGQFVESDIYVLSPFSEVDVDSYTKNILNAESVSFINQLENYSLFDLAKNPFFLNHLIEIYKTDKKIPINRSDIFSRIISLAIESDVIKLSDKFDLIHTYPTTDITRDLNYIALVMETLQRNYVSISEFNEIVADKKKNKIISELSLIKKSFFKEGDAYQFQHNNFQEYLAAIMLAKRSLNTILEFASFRTVIKRRTSWIDKIMVFLEYIEIKPLGIRVNKFITLFSKLIGYKKIDKIVPSWVNTVSFLCQLREDLDLLNYLMKNEPELALKFEISRIDENTRKELFITIFRKYTERKIWLDRDLIDYEEMAYFGDMEDIYNFLIGYAKSKEHFIYRHNAIQLIGRMNGIDGETVRELLIKYAKDETEHQNVRHICLYALSWLGLDSKDTIDSVIFLRNSNNDWILSGLYYLIAESNYIDIYVDVLISGIPRIRWEIGSSASRLMDESWNLVRGMEKVSSIEGVRKIIRYFINNPKDLQEHDIEQALERIISNVIASYDLDKTIYIDMKELAISADKNHLLQSLTMIRIFFKNTNTTLDLFKDIYSKELKGNYSILASIADEQCVKFLISEYFEGKLTDNNIIVFINFLLSRNKDEYYSLLKIINESTGKFYPEKPKDYKNEQEQILRRNVEIIFSRDEFLIEVKNIFDRIGKTEISAEDLEDISSANDNDAIINEFVLIKLMNHLEKNKKKKWKLDKLLEDIKEWNYEWFTITNIFKLLHSGRKIELTTDQETAINDFCMKNHNSINFREALKSQEEGAGAPRLAIILWYFLRKHDLEYPENVLLDLLSFDWVEELRFVGIDYLENKIPPKILKRRILENLSSGVTVEQVLRNHINYCKKHQLLEAKEQLYKVIKSPEKEMETRLLALETISDFPNITLFIEDLLDTGELELFRKAADIYMKRNSENCMKKLERKLTSQDDAVALAASKLLIEKQNITAIKYYAAYIMRTKNYESDIRNGNPLQKVRTIKALPVLIDLLKFFYIHKEEYQEYEFDRLDSMVLGVLKNIALQNYSNFIKVIKKLKKFIKRYESQFEDVNFLNFACDDIEKAFFINYKYILTPAEAINKVLKCCK